ncbi:MAG: DUF6345 domain-containing protein [Nitrospirales bacterium]
MYGQHCLPRSCLMAFYLTLMLIVCTMGLSHASTTVTLEQAVHFLNAEGSDVLVQPGTYELEATEQWLRLIPGERRDALLLDAQTLTSEEQVSEPTAVSVSGEGDEYILALVMPGGKSLQAVGSRSGTRSRALLSVPRLQARQQLIGKQLRITRPTIPGGLPTIPKPTIPSEKQTLPVFALAPGQADPAKGATLLASLLQNQLPQGTKPEDRGPVLLFRAGSKEVEIEKVSGGVFLRDTKQLWNPLLTPRLPNRDQVKSIADRFLGENRLLPAGDNRLKVSFAGFSETGAGEDIPGKIDRHILDIQANYQVEVAVPGPKGQSMFLPVVGGGGEFKVAVGDGGAVIGHNGVWRPITGVASEEPVLPKSEAEAHFRKMMETGKMRVTKVSSFLAYFSAPAFERQTHLAPVWVVGGEALLGEEPIYFRNAIIAATKYGPIMPAIKPKNRAKDERPQPPSLDPDEAIGSQKRDWLDPLYRFAEMFGLAATPAWAAGGLEAGTSWIGPSQGLNGSPANAQGFVNGLAAAGWNINFNWGEANAFESDWRSNNASWVDAADIVFYTGHAGPNSWVLNQPQDTSLHFNEVGNSPGSPNDLYGNNDLEWMIIAACGPHQSSHFMGNVGNAFDRWRGIFDGLHVFLGYGAVTYDNTSEGGRVIQLARQGWTIIDAWFRTAWEIQPATNNSSAPNGPTIFVTAMYAYKGNHETRNDHLHGMGSTVSDPTNPGQKRYLMWSGT